MIARTLPRSWASDKDDPLTRKIIACAIEVHIEDSVILELKSVERHDPVFEAQILSYMKLTDKKVGLLINFNSKMVKDGIKRFVL